MDRFRVCSQACFWLFLVDMCVFCSGGFPGRFPRLGSRLGSRLARLGSRPGGLGSRLGSRLDRLGSRTGRLGTRPIALPLPQRRLRAGPRESSGCIRSGCLLPVRSCDPSVLRFGFPSYIPSSFSSIFVTHKPPSLTTRTEKISCREGPRLAAGEPEKD